MLMKLPAETPSLKKDSIKKGKSLLDERRRHVRYRPAEGTFAAIGPGYEMVGRIRDISRGGLSFTYFDFKDVSKGPEQDFLSNQVDIYMLNNGFNLRGVRCVIVNNGRYAEKHIQFSGAMPALKRCGIRFESLSPEQEKELTRYLLSMTCGAA
jgi:hypothetical protein